MNRDQMVQKIASTTGLTQQQAEKALRAMIDITTEAVASGEEVTFVGFGKFKRVLRNARKGRNPHTGKMVEVPACLVPRFTPGKSLRDAVAYS